MLHLAFLAGLIAICVSLTMRGTWAQVNTGTSALGFVLLVVGALMEAFRLQRSKPVPGNPSQLFKPPSRKRSRIIQVGWRVSWMLLAASYFVLGLALLTLQALAFFWS